MLNVCVFFLLPRCPARRVGEVGDAEAAGSSQGRASRAEHPFTWQRGSVAAAAAVDGPRSRVPRGTSGIEVGKQEEVRLGHVLEKGAEDRELARQWEAPGSEHIRARWEAKIKSRESLSAGPAHGVLRTCQR